LWEKEIQSDIVAYLSLTAYLSKDTDSSRNIKSDFVISIRTVSLDVTLQKQSTYEIVTTSGTYYIGDKEYYNESFPGSLMIKEMGTLWSKSNILLIKELKDLVEELINTNNYATEKLVKYPLLYLYGTYFCDDVISCDIVFTVDGIDKKYTIKGIKSSDNKILFFDDDLFSDKNFKNDFIASTKVKIRVNESHCGTEYYTFTMSGSTAAYNFINK